MPNLFDPRFSKEDAMSILTGKSNFPTPAERRARQSLVGAHPKIVSLVSPLTMGGAGAVSRVLRSGKTIVTKTFDWMKRFQGLPLKKKIIGLGTIGAGSAMIESGLTGEMPSASWRTLLTAGGYALGGVPAVLFGTFKAGKSVSEKIADKIADQWQSKIPEDFWKRPEFPQGDVNVPEPRWDKFPKNETQMFFNAPTSPATSTSFPSSIQISGAGSLGGFPQQDLTPLIGLLLAGGAGGYLLGRRRRKKRKYKKKKRHN